MTNLDQQTTQGSAESVPSQTQQAQAPTPGMQPGAAPIPGLPPTAVQMQMQSLRDQQMRQNPMAAQLGGMGTPGAPLGAQMGGMGGQNVNADYARSSLKDLAERLAKGYGLEFQPGGLVDQTGQFLQTPDQLAGGGSLGDTAMNMNLVAQAINERQIQSQQQKATAALQAGAGLIGKRGTGSLAAMQSGFYQAMAANYTNPNLLPEQQDFNFWIQKDQMEEAEADIASGNPSGLGSGDAGLQKTLAEQQQAAQQAQADYDRALLDAQRQGRRGQTSGGAHVTPGGMLILPGGY